MAREVEQKLNFPESSLGEDGLLEDILDFFDGIVGLRLNVLGGALYSFERCKWEMNVKNQARRTYQTMPYAP